MVPDDYSYRVLAFMVLIFFHYICYLTFLILKQFEYPTWVHLCYGWSTSP